MRVAIFPAVINTQLIICIQEEKNGNIRCIYTYPLYIKTFIEYLQENKSNGWSISTMSKEDLATLKESKWYSLREIYALLALNPEYFKR